MQVRVRSWLRQEKVGFDEFTGVQSKIDAMRSERGVKVWEAMYYANETLIGLAV